MAITKIQTITVPAGGQATIDFTSIPQTFTDVFVVLSARGDTGSVPSVQLKFNNSSSNITSRRLYGDGSGVGSDSRTNTLVLSPTPGASDTANTFGNHSFYVPNYASTTVYKTVSSDAVQEKNTSDSYQVLTAGLWSDTSAVTSMAFTLNSGSFVEGSTATLYGVSNSVTSTTSTKATGGTIYTTGGYTYHVFTAGGTFTPTTTITNAQIMIIAGGGGGGGGYSGYDYGAGGGAGGLLYVTGATISSAQTVTVGGGGNGSTGGGGYNGGNGTDSTFGSYTAVGGGGGAGGNGYDGNSGGSGGGGANAGSNPFQQGGAGTTGQGFKGGAGGWPQTAGGGGAGGVGVSGLGGTTPHGGPAALASDWASATSTGVAGYYAGGGGGGASTAGTATGGGGKGSTNSVAATNATANTGGGGGGGAPSLTSGSNGGSGLVIVRYN